MTNNPAGGTAPDLPTISDAHLKMVHLHGLLAVVQEFEPHDLRTRNGAAALVYVAEEMANELSRDMEKLMEAERERA